MYPTPAHDPETREQISRAVSWLYGRAREVLGRQCEATPSGVTEWYVSILRQDNPPDENVDLACEQIRDFLIDEAVTDRAIWWSTPLGRSLAWYGCGPNGQRGEVPQAVIAAVLGCSHQNAARLVQKHALKFPGRVYDGEALMYALRSRWPDRLGKAA